MTSPTLQLKPNAKPRILSGHPWVFANEVVSLLPAEYDGEVVECRDRSGRFVGVGIYNSRSQICFRRISRARVGLDEAFVRSQLKLALGRRSESVTGKDGVGRLVWSEADNFPGVVIDRFGEVLVVQIQTLAMEKRIDTIGRVLMEELSPREIVWRNDAPIRRFEGLPLEVHTQSGKTWDPAWCRIEGMDYWLDLQSGQKTGFYLDQRREPSRVAAYCRGKRVLDAFCNQGPFALHAAKAGAACVLGLDSAEDAIGLARRNAEKNGVSAEFSVANVFDWFNANERNQEPLWDVIVLDPPPFAKSKSALEGALRGYKEINLRAMQRLAPGGILATYTCSHHMQDAELRQVIASAATDAKRHVQILEWCHQPSDHPVLAVMPESEYLRGYLLRVE